MVTWIWRPSRWQAKALRALGVVAAVSVLTSALPAAVAWPLAMLCGWQGWRCSQASLRAPMRALAWPVRGGAIRCDGVAMQALRARWRGPLLVLQWRDAHGHPCRLPCWPDNLPAAQRRELRLALQRAAPVPGGATVAP